MEIEFKVNKDNSEVEILNKDNGKIIGRIFTPSGSGNNTPSCIQVCGFDDCFDLWGCGVFTDNKGNPKKDIQLLFNPNSTDKGEVGIIIDVCEKCYGKDKCMCDDLKVKSYREVIGKQI